MEPRPLTAKLKLRLRPVHSDDGPAHRGGVGALVALPGGALCTAGRDGVARLWSSADGEGSAAPGCAAELRGHVDWVNDAAALPGGALATASNDGTVMLWRGPPEAALTAAPVQVGAARTLRGHGDYVKALAAAGGVLASAGLDERLLLWDAEASLAPIAGAQAAPVSAMLLLLLALLPALLLVLLMVLLPVRGMLVLTPLLHLHLHHPPSFSSGANGAERPRGQRVLRGAGRGGAAGGIGRQRGRATAVGCAHRRKAHEAGGPPWRARPSRRAPDGARTAALRVCAAGGSGGAAANSQSQVRALLLSADGGRLVSAGSDGVVKFWDLGHRACVHELRPHGGASVHTISKDSQACCAFLKDLFCCASVLSGCS